MMRSSPPAATKQLKTTVGTMMSATDTGLQEKLIGVDFSPVVTKKRKQSVLSQLVTAVGNFSVQYNFQAISIALLVMAASVCTTDDGDCKEGTQSEWVSSTATATVFVGAIAGQLSMGYAGDLLGRNHAMTLTLALVTFGAVMSAVVPHGSASSIYATIIVMRFILGVGVGGVYPLSATKATEDGGAGGDGIDLSAASWAFFWQVSGSMTPWILALIFSYCDMSDDSRWRLLLGLGAVPSSFVVCCSVLETRAAQKELRDQDLTASHALLSPAHADQFHHEADGGIGHSSHKGGSSHGSSLSSGAGSGGFVESFGAHTVPASGKFTLAEKRAEGNRQFYAFLKHPDTWVKMLVTCGGWFIYDVAYYGVNLFGGQILSSIGSSDDDNVSAQSSIRAISEKQVIALSMGIPACLCAIMALRILGTKWLQTSGFVFIAAVCFSMMAILFKPLSHGRFENTNALFAVYCILLFSLSWGPNLTTYILPAQTYPKEVRATFNGISAACGKLGAFTGVYVFSSMATATSYATVMVFCACISVFGAAVTVYGINKTTRREKRRLLHEEAGGERDDDTDSIVQ